MNEFNTAKRGSSRRKGDEFQDLTALRIILELYISGEDFKVYLEYEKATAFDDIVVFIGSSIRAVQAKCAVDNLAVYTPDDFTDTKSRTYFGRYAIGWQKLCTDHPTYTVDIELLSNRGRDSQLEEIIDNNGRFTDEFIQNKKRKGPKAFRDKLKQICAFTGANDEAEFRVFLSAFQFRLGQRSLSELESHIISDLLDHQLGISDRNVYLQLKQLIELHAIELHTPVTPRELDEIFQAIQRRYLLPQVFPVQKDHFVELRTFRDSLLDAIINVEKGYIVVTGLPGSGKSTSLSEFFDSIANDQRFATCRYFCFTSPDDSDGNRRVEAEALRVNLLSTLQRQFKNEFSRRHDYSEQNFTQILSELGKLLVSQGRKLAVLIDGLDHAERNTLVRDTVLRALPTVLPQGVIFVVGTQELRHWQPLALKQGRERDHIPIPLFSLVETREFLITKQGLAIDDTTVQLIHDKSQGLPLHLHYVSAWLQEHNQDIATLEAMPEAGQGDIRNYYERLWDHLDYESMKHARHLCGVLAKLRFPVNQDEVADFQDAIAVVDMPGALKSVAHLLRHEDGMISIFHDSFRVFVNTKLDESTEQHITGCIFSKLSSEKESTRWFAHVFHYALESKNDDYILSEIKRPFVDLALQHCRPTEDISSAITSAAHAATRKKDLVALAALGSLNYRTHERLEYQFDYGLVAKVQLTLGRVEEVLGFCCRHRERRWLVDRSVAMQVMLWCAQTKQRELGERLFEIFRETFAHAEWKERHDIVDLSQIVAIYAKHPFRFLRKISNLQFRPEILECHDSFAPQFSPHLEAFLKGYFLFAPKRDNWQCLKKINRSFPNHLVRHYLLRLVARHRSKTELADEIMDYLANTPRQQNLEVAGMAALAGLPVEKVRELAGPVILPKIQADKHLPREELAHDLEVFAFSTLVLGYENVPVAIQQVRDHIGRAKTMHEGFLRFLLETGLCLGRAAAGKSQDAFNEAFTALNELVSAGKEDGANEYDTLRACRPMLPEALFKLTQHIAKECPSKMELWRDKLLDLRECRLWTSHWGIGEYLVDYSFELRVWERLVDVPSMPSKMLPILRSCAQTYTDAEALKAGARSNHFLWLAAISARCAFRSDAENWRKKGVSCSLTYGYHKDTTLDCLIDVLEFLTQHEPELGLKCSAAILEMIKWMPDVTDGRSTKYFEQAIFPIVLKASRGAAFALIRFFQQHSGRWKMLDCLEQFCVTVQDGDPEVLWTLKDAFTPHFHESGRHPKQVTRTAQHLRDLGVALEPAKSDEWFRRYHIFIRTHIDPHWWPSDVSCEVEGQASRTPNRAPVGYESAPLSSDKELTIGGKAITGEELESRLVESVDSFFQTVDQLKAEKNFFDSRQLINSALRKHAECNFSEEVIRRLWVLARDSQNSWTISPEILHVISNRLFDLGLTDEGFECLFLAYQHGSSWIYSPRDATLAQPYLTELCQRDQDRVIDFLLDRCSKVLETTDGGFDLPRVIARFFATVGDVKALRQVFYDYLTHCEELFAHLPKEEIYGWLCDYQEDGRDEPEEIVDFLIDLLAEPEIDQAERLLHVLANLAKSRAELVSRVSIRRMQNAEPLLRARLEVLIDTLASICPKELWPNIELLLPLFNKENFGLRMSLVSVLKRVGTSVTLPRSIIETLEKVERAYYLAIAYPSRSFIEIEPSTSFVDFLKIGALYDFNDRLKSVSNLLRIKHSTILAHLERNLRSLGWNEQEAHQQRKQDWQSHVDSQGRKVVWIVPTFHTQVLGALHEFVYQALENGRYNKDVIDALFNVLRGGDPDFVAETAHVKPEDITALNISDGVAWVNQLQPIEIKPTLSLPLSGWTTVYEQNELSQTDNSDPKYVSKAKICGILVKSGYLHPVQHWPEPKIWSDAIPVYDTEENLTLQEAQTRLINTPTYNFNLSGAFLPLVAEHINGRNFCGYRRLALIHPLWIKRYSLRFEGSKILHENRCVGIFEEWQEGYEDDVYSRNLLSAGMRLIIQNEFFHTLLSEVGYDLALSRIEEREYWDNSWCEDATEQKKGVVFSRYN